MSKAEFSSAPEKAAALAKPGFSRYLVDIQSLPEVMEAAQLIKIQNERGSSAKRRFTLLQSLCVRFHCLECMNFVLCRDARTMDVVFS